MNLRCESPVEQGYGAFIRIGGIAKMAESSLSKLSQQQHSYPLLLLSTAVAEALQSVPPPVPTYRSSPAPEKTKLQPVPKAQLAISAGAGLVVALLLYAVLLQFLGDSIALLGVALALGVSGTRLIQQFRYNRRVVALQRQYEWQLADYLQQEDQARAEHREQTQDREALLSDPRRLLAFRVGRLQPLFAEIQCLRAARLAQTRPNDAAESELLAQLQQEFPDRIHRGINLMIEGLAVECLPKIAYIDPQLKLHIAVEIDRAFDFDPMTGACEPRNFIGGTRNGEHILLDQNWVVLRFTQEQALNHPRSCAKTLAHTIASVTGDKQLFANFRTVPNLPVVPCWTAEQAMSMARSTVMLDRDSRPREDPNLRSRSDEPSRLRN
ncbi:hypothetical protein [Leptolyngbya sp. FACHB-261]|uniref:hypothetical protein n=1 Tax=Leptolyngbya sp. FACHB-261 TaxID=2692806 RepID=UPI0016881EE0|nr:hypothetical protein [Leptolyngbya sp. FACHB-261]MBD2102142.1 hypothetical protein [Leptolyngbya sp. FACHB-261]